MNLTTLEHAMKFRPKHQAERFRLRDKIRFHSMIHSEDKSSNKKGEIIYIHPQGYFITIKVTYKNTNTHRESINWWEFQNVHIL